MVLYSVHMDLTKDGYKLDYSKNKRYEIKYKESEHPVQIWINRNIEVLNEFWNVYLTGKSIVGILSKTEGNDIENI